MGSGPSMLVEQPFSFERRVLHVGQPDVGGVPAYIDALSVFQSNSGWEVHVAGPVSPSTPSVRHHRWTAARNPVVGLASESRALRHIIDAVEPDVVMLHSAKAGLVGRLVLRGAIPTVYVPHAWSFLSLPSPLAAQASVWERIAARWTNLVMTVSEGEARLGIDAGVSAPMVVVANPVPPTARVAVSRDSSLQRDQLALPERPTVVSVGRLCEQKGQDMLLDSWRQVRRTQPEAQLVLVGDGDLREHLQSQADESVLFVGTQSNVIDWLGAADVVAMPSRWEGMSLSMLEAMSAGRPVVTHQVPGADVVVRARAGAAVAVGDIEGFSAALRQRLRRPRLARQEGVRGARYVAVNHDAATAFTAASALCVRAHAFGAPAGVLCR